MSSNIEARLEALENRVAILEATAGGSTTSVQRPIKVKTQSPKEFLMGLALKSAVEKTLALGYFIETIQGSGHFNIDDIEATFRLAKEKVPGNIGDMVNKNIKKGVFMEHDEKKDGKKAWVLTATGESFAENGFKEAKL